MSERHGTILWFNNAKGYGFISDEIGSQDVFCHYSAIQMEGYKSLTQGDEVEFDVVEGRTGKMEARNVRRRQTEPSGRAPAKGDSSSDIEKPNPSTV